ncbi:hypothetical protein IscW_ISCW022448 [Ixodes scapularis]|uniref:Uncharacterized protein n=1 Tax=Ixodes scapularis TaxID=6945 RepID=B7QAT3_IXOSC|nr:hypothetical protein IscW_ISCW022448 [Ixodes scapularis]|eukprot:XP_002412659.1 hypothetical protein IscW_ISCW022448 [Ixodes scapularis]
MLVGKEAARDFRQRHQTFDEKGRAERYREMYAKLCRKLDEEEKLEEEWEKSLLDSDDDSDDESDEGETRTIMPTAPMPTMEELAADPIVERLKILEREVGRLSLGTAEVSEGDVTGKKAARTNQRRKPARSKSNGDVPPAENDAFLPIVDSRAQNVHRRRIVLDRLKKLLPDILDLLYLDLSEISPDLTEMVVTFR